MLAMLWNELADSHNGAVFEQEFRSGLEHLDRFINDFPEAPPTVLIRLLEEQVIDALRERVSRERILAFRAWLNRSN